MDGATSANDEEELVQDIMTLMAVFSGRLYGKRSAKRRKEKKRNCRKNLKRNLITV